MSTDYSQWATLAVREVESVATRIRLFLQGKKYTLAITTLQGTETRKGLSLQSVIAKSSEKLGTITINHSTEPATTIKTTANSDDPSLKNPTIVFQEKIIFMVYRDEDESLVLVYIEVQLTD